MLGLALLPWLNAQADFNIRDVTSAVGEVKKLLPNDTSARNRDSYIRPGMSIDLPNGKLGKVYGTDCRPGERRPCSSIKLVNGGRRVLIVPDNGGKTVEERWTFRRLGSDRIVAIRPDGTTLEPEYE